MSTNERKWTPGPWLVDDGNGDGPLGVFDRQGQRIAYLSEYGSRAVDWERVAETDQANAHLIAAAPEMYEALRDELVWLESLTTEHVSVSAAVKIGLNTRRMKIRAMLAKADGRDSGEGR